MHDLSHIPLQSFVNDGGVLIKWLGSFWTKIFTQPELIQSYQLGNAINLAQIYLNFIEALNLTDRNNAPVFHRERWKPVILRLSEKNTGMANLLRTDMVPAPVIGVQPADSTYAPGKTFKIGGHAEYVDVTSYPLDSDITDIATGIADNIIMPNRVLTRGIDFFVRDSTLFFLRGSDPFESTAFPVLHSADDEEVLLWACNTLIDRDFIYRHLGYALSLRRTSSSQFYKNMINGLWDMYNLGTPLRWLTGGLGALLGEPTVGTDGEVVELIRTEEARKFVITDKMVYTVNVDSTLRSAVTPGAVLNAGEFLTETIRIYDTLDPMKLAGANEYGERITTDVPSLFFGPAFFRSDLKFGIGAAWDTVDIICRGTDGSGNAKLNFKLYGSDEDVSRFWSDFWAEAELSGYTSETCFQDYLNAIVVPVDGSVCGRVSPIAFFMRYFLRANAMIVVVDRSKLSEPDPYCDSLAALNYLKEVIPAHIALFIVEQRDLGPERYDLGVVDPDASDYDGAGGTSHGLVPAVATTVAEAISEGRPSATAMTYTVRPPITRWIATCKE